MKAQIDIQQKWKQRDVVFNSAELFFTKIDLE